MMMLCIVTSLSVNIRSKSSLQCLNCILKSYLRTQYGQETQKIVDVFGKELLRVARFANHHHFNIRCLKTGHCPPSLKLKSPVNRQGASSSG